MRHRCPQGTELPDIHRRRQSLHEFIGRLVVDAAHDGDVPLIPAQEAVSLSLSSIQARRNTL
jgi:hypothetical protein